MSSAHTDLKAIQKKMRSLKHDRRVTDPVSPPPDPGSITATDSWDDAPGLDGASAIATVTPSRHRADPAATLQALRQRSQATVIPGHAPRTVASPVTELRSPGLSPGQSTGQSLGQSTGLSLGHPAIDDPVQVESPPTQLQSPPPGQSWVTTQHQQQQRQQLKAIVQRANRAAVEQETALLELCRLLQIVPADIAEDWDDLAAMTNGVTQPWIEQSDAGQWQLQTRFIDLNHDQQEAEFVAQFLRNPPWNDAPTRTLRHRLRPLIGWLKRQRSPWPTSGSPAVASHPSPRLPINDLNRSDLSLMDVAIWVAGAALLRFGFTALVTSLAIPMPIAFGLGAVLVAIGLYVGATQSASGLTFFYRCALVAIGILLGGRIA